MIPTMKKLAAEFFAPLILTAVFVHAIWWIAAAVGIVAFGALLAWAAFGAAAAADSHARLKALRARGSAARLGDAWRPARRVRRLSSDALLKGSGDASNARRSLVV